MRSVEQFITAVLSGSQSIQAATRGRVYAFTTAQGVHTYPLIWWHLITAEPTAQDLCSVGEAWQTEAQIDVFCKSVSAAARLAEMVFAAFNTAQLTANILDSRAVEIVPSYANEDATIHYAVRVLINHQLNNSNI